MEYVMVPVPEEHVVEFQDGLMQIALRASMSKWTAPAVEQLLEELPAPWRTLVVELTRRSGEPRQPTRESVAAATGLHLDDLVPMGSAINDHCKSRDWPHLVMAGEQRDAPGGTMQKTIFVNHHAAGMLRDLLGAEAAPR